MTPEEFKIKAQELYDEYKGFAGEDGHFDMDMLLKECLESIGYQDGVAILRDLDGIWYA